MTGVPAELRFPCLDLRLISFCLQLPPIPWCVDKQLLRRAGRQWLPETVTHRPKAPLTGFPDHEHLLQAAATDNKVAELPDAFDAYIDLPTYRKIARQPQKLRPDEHTLITYPLRLARWLQHQDKNGSKEKERSPWQIPRKKRSTKSPITPRDCASTETSTA